MSPQFYFLKSHCYNSVVNCTALRKRKLRTIQTYTADYIDLTVFSLTLFCSVLNLTSVLEAHKKDQRSNKLKKLLSVKNWS